MSALDKILKGGLGAIKAAGRAANEQQAAARAAVDAEVAEKMANLPARDKKANEAMGLYHPVGGGIKLSTPTRGMHSTTVDDPKFTQPPIKIITPEQMVKERAAIIPLVGDRAAAGKYLTHVGQNELGRPVRLTGGPRYMDANYNAKTPDESAAWESGLGVVTKIGNQATRAGEGGRPVYGAYTAGSETNTDFNVMGANALMQQMPFSKITKKAEREFDRAMKVGTKASPPLPNWPGILNPKAEELLLDKSNGVMRTKLFDTMGKENFQSMGFPNVPATRKAIIEPELLNVPTNEVGFRLANMDTAGRIIESPKIPSDYPTAMAGQLAGKLDVPVDYKDFFQSHFDARRLLGKDEKGDYYSFSRAKPIQYADEEWLNRLRESSRLRDEAIKKGSYADGGAVEASEEGGSADDFDARVGKLIDQHHFDNRLNDMIDQHMAGGGLAKGIKAGVKMLFADAPQAKALKLAQERAALPPSKGGLGLPKNNTAEQRAAAMGTKTDVYHGTKQDITGAFKPGYDDNLAFVTKSSEFANNWIGKGKKQARVGKEAEEEVKAAEEELRKMKYEKMDYESLKDMRGKPFYAEYDKRSDAFKKAFQETIGIYPDKTHSTVYPLKVQANKTFNPETDMDVMAEFFEKNNIPKSSQDLYAGGNYMMYETKPVVEYLKGKGYDSMRLRESTGDDYPTIAVFNPEAVRSRFAAFDPFRRDAATAALMGVAAPDLLAAEPEKKANGGKIVKGAMNIGKRIMADSSLPALEREANLQKFLEPSKAPMRLYHGTTATEGGKGTEAIRRLKPSKDGALGSGTYLTPSTANASGYSGSPNDEAIAAMLGSKYQADTGLQFLRNRQAGNVLPGQEGGNMLPVHAQIRNPLIIEGTHGDPMVEALTKLGMAEDKASRMVERAYENKGYIGKEVQSRAQAQGYDGLMQYRDGELSEVVSYNPNAVKSAIGNQGTYDISQPDLSKAEGGVAHMGAGGKISKLMADILKSEGRYGAGRLERAADEIPNLEKMYQREALMRAFSGDNAKALMTMNPKDFERYAARLTVQNYPLKAPLKNDVPTKWNSATEDYVRSLSGLPKGFNDVPFLMIDKAEQGLPLVPYIAGHEGRHRNRALAGKGVQSGLIQLLPRSELREGFPRRSQQEYIEALKKELEMTGNKVKPEGYSSDAERSAILLPDIYADGGAVHMKESGTARDFKPAETLEQEIMRYLRMLRVNAAGGVSQGGASVGGRLGVEIPVSENVSIEPYVQGFAGFGKPQGGGGANLKFRFSNGGGASGTNADILDVIAQSKAKTGPSTAALPRYGNMTPENQFEREFRARLAKEQAARENAVKRGVGAWIPEIPGFIGDLAVDLPYNIAQRAAGRRGDSIKPLGFGEDVRRVVGQTMGTAPTPSGETGMSAPPDKMNENVTDLLEIANPLMWGAAGNPLAIAGMAVKGAKLAGKGAKSLGPTAAKLAEEYMMSTGMMLPVVKPKGGNWVTGSAEDSLKGLKRQGTAVMPFNETDLAERIAQGYTVHDPATGTYSKPNPINQFVDKQLTRYVKNEMGTPEDPVRLAADAFPAAKAKMLADKQKQIDKATADMEKARAERGFTPEMMTRSQARIRDLEKEKELIEYRTGLHYEPQRGSARAKEVREALGMPLDPVSTSPYGQAWENKSDTAISGLPYRLRLPMVSPDTAPDALRALGGEFAAQNPNALAYSVSPYVKLRNLGFDHIVDELSNAINPVSGLPKGLIVDPNDLSKWTVPQAVEHVDKINAWRAAQKAEADLDRANNVATVLHKDFPDKGMRWVELKIPEALPEGWSKSASGAYIDPQGGKTIYNPNRQSFLNSMKYEGEQMQHCVAGDRYCRAVELGDSRIFSLRDAKGKPHATIETQKNSLDQYLDKLPDKTYDQWIEEFKNLPEYNNADPLWRPGASPEWTKFLKENKGLNEIPDSIAQIKGPRDRTPKEEYFPYIQDFVKSGKWGNVEELFNAGLHKVGDNYLTQPEMDALIKANGGMKRGGAVRMDDGGLLEKELEDARRAATVNPLMARKFAAQRQNVTEPTSIMDERYPAWKKSQDEADLFLLGADMATSVAPFVSPLAKGAIATAKSAPEILARGLEKYMVRTGGILPMDVYHGSPHRFPPTAKNPLGEFDASKIGTGEGAQAYGHGLYFAERPATAETYARALAKDQLVVDGRKMNFEGVDYDKVLKKLGYTKNTREYDAASTALAVDLPRAGWDFDKVIAGVGDSKNAAFRKNILGELKGRVSYEGQNLYKVDLPDEHIAKMLDWDKPLSQQSAEVQAAFKLQDMGGTPAWDEITGLNLYNQLAGRLNVRNPSPMSGSEAASDFLKKAGIPGIRYLDGGSRAGGQGTSNFVVFDPSHLNILGRNKRAGGLALTRTSLRQRKPNQLAR